MLGSELINHSNETVLLCLLLLYSTLFIYVPPLHCVGRRSLHHFDDPEEEASSLIYNYMPVYAGNFTGYEQLYFF